MRQLAACSGTMSGRPCANAALPIVGRCCKVTTLFIVLLLCVRPVSAQAAFHQSRRPTAAAVGFARACREDIEEGQHESEGIGTRRGRRMDHGAHVDERQRRTTTVATIAAATTTRRTRESNRGSTSHRCRCISITRSGTSSGLGSYLVNAVGDCNGCHSGPSGELLPAEIPS